MKYWVLLLSAVVLLGFQQSDRSDAWEGVDPHDVPACHRAGGKDAAPCRCRDMVTSVQVSRRDECYAKFDDRKERTKCIMAIPDHCSIISYDGQFGDHWETVDKMPQRCRTRCKPERCGCRIDPKCPSHEEEMAMEQERREQESKKNGRRRR